MPVDNDNDEFGRHRRGRGGWRRGGGRWRGGGGGWGYPYPYYDSPYPYPYPVETIEISDDEVDAILDDTDAELGALGEFPATFPSSPGRAARQVAEGSHDSYGAGADEGGGMLGALGVIAGAVVIAAAPTAIQWWRTRG